MGEVPTILQRGVMSDVASKRKSVSDLGPFMYSPSSLNASRRVRVVCSESSTAGLLGGGALDLLPPPRIALSQLETMVR